jgi:hypothetical protein
MMVSFSNLRYYVGILLEEPGDNKAGQAMYFNVKMITRLRVIISAVEKQQLLHVLMVCLWPLLPGMQSELAVLCSYPWPVWLYHRFRHCLTNGTIFGEKKKVIA